MINIKKKVVLITVLTVLALSIIPVNSSTSTNFVVYTESLGIQFSYSLTDQTDWVLLEAETNFINSSSTTLVLDRSGQGYFSFLSNESFDLKLTYTSVKVYLSGDQGNEKRAVENLTSHSVSASNTVTVYWTQILRPYVPITFLFWIVGLVMMFVGPFMGIKHLKKGEYREGLIIITVLCAMGFSLLLGGMFSA